MPSDIIEPHTDAPVPEAPRPSSPPAAGLEGDDEAAQPRAPGSGSSSGDDLGLSFSSSLGPLAPDPLLSEFIPDGASVTGQEPSPPVEGPVTAPEPPAPEPAEAFLPSLESGSGVDIKPSSLVEPSPDEPKAHEIFEPHATTVSSAPDALESFSALDLSAPSSPKAAAEPEAKDDEEESEQDEPAPRGPSWPMVLLTSYASAVTLGLIWVLWGGRMAHEGSDSDPFPPADTRPDPGRRASHSREVAPPSPIPANHLTTLGKPLRLGALEVTPLEVASGRVDLQRTFTSVEHREGGNDVLKLRLRLRNASTDKVFSPLDETFLREREQGVLDSFIELPQGEPIDMFPLAVESEWSIVGQEFRDLKPGQTYETIIASAADAVGRKAPEMTWRVRLRTDINQTDTVGVRFKDSDVKPGP